MKKHVVIVLIALMVVLATCSRSDQQGAGSSDGGGEKKLKFAQIYSVVHPFFEPCDRGGKDKAAELGVDLVIDAPAQADIALQVNMIENYINQGVDGIAICAVAGDGLKPVIAKAMDAGIPVIMFGVDALGSRRISYVGTNQEEFAEHAADLLAAQMNNEGDIIVNMGVATAPDQITRVEYFQKVLVQKYPNMKVLDVQAGESDPAKALANVENMMQAHPNAKGFYGTDSNSGAAVISAMKGKGRKLNVVVGDDTAEIIAGIRNGDLPVTIVQDPYDWAYKSVQALYDLKQGKTIDEYIWTRLIDVTKNNVDELYPH
jgi:ribose transport system substrate-binding protein